MRDRNGVDPDERGGREELWAAEEEETVSRIHNERQKNQINKNTN